MSIFRHDSTSILKVLDTCCGNFTFPMLDNGYVYLAASRLSLHRSEEDWALVIEIFGFSPRSGVPDLHVYTFGSQLYNRHRADEFDTPEAYQAYLASNPNNESCFFQPVEEGGWIDEDESETVALAGNAVLRGLSVTLPSVDQYSAAGIELESDRPAIFEFCRYLAHHFRDQVLATPSERRASLPPDLAEILFLEDWHHPDVIAGELPSQAEAFQQLAEVLVSGDTSQYCTAEPPNTNWQNWPDGGTL